MSAAPLTPNAYQNIVAHAWVHILKGGGVVPDDGCAELDDTISEVAAAHFGADKVRAELDRTLAGLGLDTSDRIMTAALDLVARYADAGFTLGAAVAMQLRGGRAMPKVRHWRKGKPSGGKKGGRS